MDIRSPLRRRHPQPEVKSDGMPSTWPRGRRLASLAAFVYLSATIVVMASERVYWYWSGFTVDSVVFLGAFYLIPTMAGLWALALAPAQRLHQVVLAGAIFAFVVEGVLTPIIYIDGPLPLMAAMFIGWHGIIAFTGFWFAIRRWLLAGQIRVLAAASVAFGAFWGIWASASSLNDRPSAEELIDLGSDGRPLNPEEFTTYVFLTVATLAAAHWLIGFVWPQGWRPSLTSTRLVVAVAALYMIVAVVVAVPWAPAKLAILIGGTWKLLRRKPHPNVSNPDRRHLLDQMAGRVRVRYLAPLALMPAAAALTYAQSWQFRTSESLLSGVYWTLVAVQIVAGAVAFVWAWRRARTLSAPIKA